jgi:hypothetical protein
MEGFEAFIKTAQSPALLMGLGVIWWLLKRVEKLEAQVEKEREKNERLTDMLKDVFETSTKATASALRQFKRILQNKPEDLDQTGEFNERDITHG